MVFFTALRLDSWEQGHYYMRRLGLLLNMMGIRNVYHHGGADFETDTLYVFTYIPSRKVLYKLRNVSWKKKEVVIDAECHHRSCFDVEDVMRDILRWRYYDILVRHSNGRPLAVYLSKYNVIITSDLFHDIECQDTTIKTFAKLFSKVSEMFPEKILTDSPILFLVDMGDYVIDLRDGRKYPKVMLTMEMKKELLRLLLYQEQSGSWET